MTILLHGACDNDLAAKIVQAAQGQRSPGRVATAPGAITLGSFY